MNFDETTYLRDAGTLLAFGLRPTVRPSAEPAYRQLLHKYQDDMVFRRTVTEIAEGLGLHVVRVSGQGLVLAPFVGSVFAMKWDDYRTQSADDRLIDGLIFIAIMTTVFPRPEDLEEDPMRVRRPVTTVEVEQKLRSLCAALEAQSRQRPDISVEDECAGLFEAWRASQNRPAVTETADNRRASRSTRSLIERALEFLREHGCFVRRGDDYQATWRYHVLVQEFSVEPLYALVQDALRGDGKGVEDECRA